MNPSEVNMIVGFGLVRYQIRLVVVPSTSHIVVVYPVLSPPNQKHYDPTVKTYATHLISGAPSQGKGSLPPGQARKYAYCHL